MHRHALSPLALTSLLIAVGLLVGSVAYATGRAGDSGSAAGTAAAGVVVMVVALGLTLASRERDSALVFALAGGAIGLAVVATAALVYAGAFTGGSDAPASASAAPASDLAGALMSQEVSERDRQEDVHDVGAHPTIGQFLSMSDAEVLAHVPAGTLTPAEVGVLRQQLQAAYAVAQKYHDVRAAEADGYRNTTNDVPFMGAHFLNSQYVADGVFDPAKPEGLLYSKLGQGDDAEWKLVGVWYLLVPGVNPGVTATIPPEGFAGSLDLWHEHIGLCTRNGIISENNTREDCLADGGRWVGDLRWMMHAWVAPEVIDNPEGVFTYLNAELYRQQVRNQTTDADAESRAVP
ncbi:MAG TPA: hypothetical protein VNM43_01625 [Dehalococcoidia bacterium]|nr:hypothetical protein [Dehalococcoidia bacterium]